MIEYLPIDFDEMGFTPTTLCGVNPEEYACKRKSELVSEIERLKAENERVLGKLADVLMCIKSTTEIDVSKLVKQAKIDVLNELRNRLVVYYPSVISEIDEMIAEVRNAEDKS